MDEQQEQEQLGRRRLLRGAGAVVAGVAGASVAGAVAATPAQAAPGDTLTAGGDVNAGATTTVLRTNTLAGVAYQLENTATTTVGVPPNDFVEAGAALQITPSGDSIASAAPEGAISMDQFGQLWQMSPGNFKDVTHSTLNSNMIVAINPIRAVDTRNTAGRRLILNPAALGTDGRLRAGQTMNVDLSEFVLVGDAVFVNPAAIAPNTGGFLSLFPLGNAVPATANVGFGTNSNVSNFAIVGIGFNQQTDNGISVFASNVTHVIIDIYAFVVAHPSVVSANLTTGGGPTLGAQGARSAQAAARRAKLARALDGYTWSS
jgi:hypothetical protein